jgi:hypothetical protein
MYAGGTCEYFYTGKYYYLPGIQRKFRIKDAALNGELLEEQFESITPFNVIHKKYAFPLYQLELEHNIGKKEFVDFSCPSEKSDTSLWHTQKETT